MAQSNTTVAPTAADATPAGFKPGRQPRNH
jgi:hypothetical protein